MLLLLRLQQLLLIISFLSNITVPSTATPIQDIATTETKNNDLTSSYQYIFEFDSSSNADTNNKKLVNQLKKSFPNFKFSTTRVINHSLLKAATIQIEENDNNKKTPASPLNEKKSTVDRVFTMAAKSGYVTKVYPNHSIQRPNVIASEETGSLLSVKQDDDSDANRHLMSILPQMQVDRVHSELKNTGKDIIIGIIDSGQSFFFICS